MKNIIYAAAPLQVPTMSAIAAVQETPSPTTISDTATLREIVVTAQKRSKNLQEAPISVVTKTGEQLADSDIKDISGIVNTTQINTLPQGLNARSTVGAFRPHIRGVETSWSIVANPVALYIDGVYMPQQRQGIIKFHGLEQSNIAGHTGGARRMLRPTSPVGGEDANA